MRPILVSFTLPFIDYPITIYGYGVMLGLSFVLGWYLTLYLASRRKLDDNPLYVAMTLAAFGSLIGARIVYVIANPEESWSLADFFNFQRGGMVAYGGYLGGIISGVAYVAIKKLDYWTYLDCATPALALGLGLTRIGCFLNGCCYGRRTDFLTGLSFPKESLCFKQHVERGLPLLDEAHTLPVHPTQLYESAFGFGLFFVLIWLSVRTWEGLGASKEDQTGGTEDRSQNVTSGRIFFVFAGAYAVWRFLIEFVRDDMHRGGLIGISTSQWISLGALGFTLFMILYWLPRHPWSPATKKKVVASSSSRRKSRRKKTSKK